MVVSLMGMEMTPGRLAAPQLAVCILACTLGSLFMPRVMHGPFPPCGLQESGLKPQVRSLVTVLGTRLGISYAFCSPGAGWQGGLNPATVRWPPRASEATQRHEAPTSLQIPKLQPPSVRAGAPKMP